DLGAKIFAGWAAKIDLSQSSSRPFPAAMVPWSQHDEIVIAGIEFLKGRVGRQGAVIIFLIPPAAHHERRHRCRFQIIFRTSCLPIAVVIRVAYERVPRREVSGIQFSDLAEPALFQIPVVRVFIESDLSNVLRTLHHPYVLIAVALPESAIVKEVV